MDFSHIPVCQSGHGHLCPQHRQKGQALVYGLFVLVAGLAGLFFLFNTGQLAFEKTKLTNTADAVAYSGGVMNARALNFQAYTNRAMLANTVAIAQLVSLSSWTAYAQTYGLLGGSAAYNPKYYGALLTPYLTAATLGDSLNTSFNESESLKGMAVASDQIIRQALMTAQKVAYFGLVPARKTLMDEVASANYKDDGQVGVGKIPLTVTEFTSFITAYDGNQRTRFADLAQTAAKKDPFVDKRSWQVVALYPDCGGALLRGATDWVNRRGGTELIGLDEWRAADSQSEWRWKPRDKWDALCSDLYETPQGWGGTSAANGGAPLDLNPGHYDSALLTNPTSTALAQATTRSWDYSGLPGFYDLTADNLGNPNPKMLMSITVSRPKRETKTSEGRSAIGSSQRINAYQAAMPTGDEMVAVSSSEVFFLRDGSNKDNVYGASIGNPQELASLFNPYWQVRLVHSDVDVRKAQTLQGVVLP